MPSSEVELDEKSLDFEYFSFDTIWAVFACTCMLHFQAFL